jgi:PKD repeat protein
MIVNCNDSDESKSSNQVPNVNFSFQANKLSVVFYDKTSDDGTIISREWNFGDGSPIINSQTTEQRHSYNDFKTYEVTLKVTDDKEQTGSFTQNLKRTNVRNLTPP